MELRHLSAAPALALVALVLFACGTPPDKEMNQARGAIETARAAGAQRYAPDEFRGATEALARAEQAVLQRDYRLALNDALDASEHAQDAAKAAADHYAAIRSEAERAVDNLAASADELRKLIEEAESARPPRGTRQALSDARRAIVVANVALQRAREALGQKDYVAATAAVAGSSSNLKAALETLHSAVDPAAGKRPR